MRKLKLISVFLSSLCFSKSYSPFRIHLKCYFLHEAFINNTYFPLNYKISSQTTHLDIVVIASMLYLPQTAYKLIKTEAILNTPVCLPTSYPQLALTSQTMMLTDTKHGPELLNGIEAPNQSLFLLFFEVPRGLYTYIEITYVRTQREIFNFIPCTLYYLDVYSTSFTLKQKQNQPTLKMIFNPEFKVSSRKREALSWKSMNWK